MPTREQIESVIAEIERLQFEQPGDEPWAAHSHGEKYVALAEIEWAGFTRREEMVVIGRILADQPPELWMEGIDRHDDDRLPSPDELRALAEEIRRDEFAARVRDYGEADAATYDARMAEAYRHRALALGLAGSAARPPIADAELERLLDELERGWAEGHGTRDNPSGPLDEADRRNTTGHHGDGAPRREPSAGASRSPGDSLFSSDEPVGFQVWHKLRQRYEFVASVESNALGAIMMTTHGFMGYERWPDNPAASAAPGEHRSTDIGDVLIGRDGQSLEISADDGLRLKPIAHVDRIPSDGKGTLAGREETPLERVERQLRDRKIDHASFWEDAFNEAGRLRVLEGEFDWTGVAARDKKAVIAREVDFSKITPEEFEAAYQNLVPLPPPAHPVADDVWKGISAGRRADLVRRMDLIEDAEFFEDGQIVSVYGAGVVQGNMLDWGELPRDVKREVLDGHVDWKDLPREQVSAIIEDRLKDASREHELASLEDRIRRLEERADPFLLVEADPRREWEWERQVRGPERGSWDDLPTEGKIAFLADFAVRHDVPFERFAAAAQPMLGGEPGQEYPAEDRVRLQHEFRQWQDEWSRRWAELKTPIEQVEDIIPLGQPLDESGETAAVRHGPVRQPSSIHLEPGKDNALSWRDDRSLDIHDATGKIGYLTGYLGGPWSDAEFRVTHVEISEPGRRLSPGEWKAVLHSLREQLPDFAEHVGGNRGGEGGGLDPAHEKLVRLPPPAAGPTTSPADLVERPGPAAPAPTNGHTPRPKP
jgi:hypothetical protein